MQKSCHIEKIYNYPKIKDTFYNIFYNLLEGIQVFAQTEKFFAQFS